MKSVLERLEDLPTVQAMVDSCLALVARLHDHAGHLEAALAAGRDEGEPDRDLEPGSRERGSVTVLQPGRPPSS